MTTTNTHAHELAKFAAAAPRWWDPQGEMKPLHDINPVRVNFIDERAALRGARVLDVGCGGGVLSEAMAARGAHVTGIDASVAVIGIAKLHLLESGHAIDYHCCTAEAYAATQPALFDIVTCMEMLEHVPDPASVIAACAQLVRPGGTVVFSTFNRNPKSFLFGIVGAEYLLGLVPKGTHDYAQFIRPSELDEWTRHAGLTLRELKGLGYNPILRQYSLTNDIDVNYLAYATRD